MANPTGNSGAGRWRGRAKLAWVAGLLPAGALTVVVNTADDFELSARHLMTSTPSCTRWRASPIQTGGVAGGWTVMEAWGQLDGETCFRLGDKDLATHIERTRRLRAGEKLSAITRDLARRLGVKPTIVPMSDDPVRTVVTTDRGDELAFQDWFVRLRCEPVVRSLHFAGATAKPHPALLDAAGLRGVSSAVQPFVSVAPIVACPACGQPLCQDAAVA
jgi:LPPG:FO 2-phospho-L-lactate transferase